MTSRFPSARAGASRPAASAQMGGAAVGDRPAEDVMGEAVDLEEDDPGHIGVDRAAPAARLTADDVPVPGVVLVDRQQRVEDRGQGADPDRDHDPLEDAVDVGPGDQVDREGDEDRVQQQRAEAEGEDRQRQRDPGQHGQTRALRTPITAAAPSAARAPSRTKPGSTSASRSRATASSSRTSRPRQNPKAHRPDQIGRRPDVGDARHRLA